jgi:Fe2+ transport system protein B
MMQETDLSILARKYQERIQFLESELSEEKRKLALVTEMIDLLKKEGISYEQEKLFDDLSPVLSQRYKDMTMTEAIYDILRAHEHEKLSADDIYKELVKNGFGLKSKSKNVKRDVYTRLLRLEQGEKLTATKKKKGRPKRYFLPRMGGEKNEDEIKRRDGQIPPQNVAP